MTIPTAIEFFKLLPKTNCKDCGQPTCLAFAMLLANQKAKMDGCPHIDEGSRTKMEESSAPPVRTVRVGSGKGTELGGETVLYRHERRFVNPTAYAVTVRDTDDAAERISKIGKLRFERVGTVFAADMVNIKHTSDDAFKRTVAAVMEEWDGPFILECGDADVLAEVLPMCRDRRPLIFSATSGNVAALSKLSKEHSCPLALSSGDLSELADMVEEARSNGAEDLVLDPMPMNLKECLERHTVIRRAALKKKFRTFGHPIMDRVGSGEHAVAMAALSTMKYGSLVVFDDLMDHEALPLFTLRHNIYTDPQVPIQVKQALYPVNDPDEHSPVFFTTNFSLTYFTVRADIEKSKMPVWLQIVNTEGLSVLTAYAAGKFDPEHVAKAFEESSVLARSDGPVVVPGLTARMSGKLQELTGRRVVVGTTESKQIPKFLKELK